jgi:hypothetical protein
MMRRRAWVTKTVLDAKQGRDGDMGVRTRNIRLRAPIADKSTSLRNPLSAFREGPGYPASERRVTPKSLGIGHSPREDGLEQGLATVDVTKGSYCCTYPTIDGSVILPTVIPFISSFAASLLAISYEESGLDSACSRS